MISISDIYVFSIILALFIMSVWYNDSLTSIFSDYNLFYYL